MIGFPGMHPDRISRFWCILLPTLTYGSENWTWNGAQQSRVRAVEMSYLRGACGVTRWDGLSNESMYERCGMRKHGSGVGCGMVEWVKRSTLRWFGHIERMEHAKFVKKMYRSVVLRVLTGGEGHLEDGKIR